MRSVRNELQPGLLRLLRVVAMPTTRFVRVGRTEDYQLIGVDNPLGEKHLDPDWIGRLGQSGKDCYDAILAKDVFALGASMNECMLCWETILPHTVRHETVGVDLPANPLWPASDGHSLLRNMPS